MTSRRTDVVRQPLHKTAKLSESPRSTQKVHLHLQLHELDFFLAQMYVVAIRFPMQSDVDLSVYHSYEKALLFAQLAAPAHQLEALRPFLERDGIGTLNFPC